VARPLRYSDLLQGGILSEHVDAFTLFPTVDLNDAFLDVLNFTDGTEESFPQGDGLCENLRVYSHITREERDGEIDAPSLDPDSEEYDRYIKRSKAARKKWNRHWKDDYLGFCIYIRAGTTQAFAACLIGVSPGRFSDIFHEWCQVLDDALTSWFPRPTRSQLLRAYPSRFIEADGHARCSLLLNAFEIFTQSSSNYNVASSTHSEYKKHCTVKFLGGTDPIGCPWAGTVPDGNPGRASDVIMTVDTKILRQVPFGHTTKVDKGFIVDNEAATEGVVVDRPQKKMRKQVQQSTVDTSQTQKIGNTKLQIRYLNVLIPCLQFPMISKVVRVGYPLQNFKKAIIQNNIPSDNDIPGGRPCRAEIRWYGATDTGLRDVRANVRLWGLRCEIDRHAELSGMEENKDKSAVEISEMVLAERWDLKMRRRFYSLHGKEYDGGDL